MPQQEKFNFKKVCDCLKKALRAEGAGRTARAGGHAAGQRALFEKALELEPRATPPASQCAGVS
jgi:hypothetical protein